MELKTIAFKNIARKKSRSFMIMIGLIVAMTTFSVVMLLSSAFKAAVDDQLDQYGFNITVVPKSSSLSLTYGGINVSGISAYKTKYLGKKDLGQINKVQKNTKMIVSPKLLEAVKINDKQALFVGVDKKKELKIKGWWKAAGPHDEKDHKHNSNDKTKADSGNTLQELSAKGLLNENDLIVGSAACEKLGLKTGDIVQINGKDFRVKVALMDTGSQDDNIVFGNLAYAQELFGKKDKYNLIEVMASDSDRIEEITGDLSRSLPNASVSSLQQAVKYKESAMNQLSRFGLVITMIILGISSIIVFTTMASSVNERATEIGVFRAIGFRKTKIIKIILWEAGILSALGGLIGFLNGFGLVKLLPTIFKALDVNAKPDIFVLAGSVGIATVIGILSSLGPAIKAAMLDPAETLKSL